MMRPTSPDPHAPSTAPDGNEQDKQPPVVDWRLRYDMGRVELIGWMIVGGLLGLFVCALLVAATGPVLDLGL